jgi:hypothetical protein
LEQIQPDHQYDVRRLQRPANPLTQTGEDTCEEGVVGGEGNGIRLRFPIDASPEGLSQFDSFRQSP